MSLSGLCSTASSGNVEVGNLLSGSPGSFDYLLDSLTIGPPADDTAALPVALRPDHGPQPDQVILRSARWQGGVLTVVADRDLPIAEHVRLRAGEDISDDAAPDVGGAVATFRLAGTVAGQALERTVPVALLLRGDGGEWTATTPTWPYHVDALRGRLLEKISALRAVRAQCSGLFRSRPIDPVLDARRQPLSTGQRIRAYARAADGGPPSSRARRNRPRAPGTSRSRPTGVPSTGWRADS